MSRSREASCQCGQLTLRCEAEPLRLAICHCDACQKRTGSVFGVQARFADKAVTVTGQYRVFRRKADSGNQVDHHFCPDCGSNLFLRLEALPGFTVVPVGQFNGADFPEPELSVYHVRRHGWVQVPASAEIID